MDWKANCLISFVKRIVDEVMIPEFKNGDYVAGINAGALTVMKVATGEYKDGSFGAKHGRNGGKSPITPFIYTHHYGIRCNERPLEDVETIIQLVTICLSGLSSSWEVLAVLVAVAMTIAVVALAEVIAEVSAALAAEVSAEVEQRKLVKEHLIFIIKI